MASPSSWPKNRFTLDKRGIRLDKEAEVPVVFEGVEIGRHRLDLLVEDLIVVGLKPIPHMSAAAIHIPRMISSEPDGSRCARSVQKVVRAHKCRLSAAPRR